MAAKRSIPTTLFASPDFFELSTDTIRLILIGIILDADDEGRGSAHPRLLARKLDKCPEDINQALDELEAHGILRCYVVEERPYYVLCHWHKYQLLSRPTPSGYPQPPEAVNAEPQNPLGNPEESRNPQDSSGDSVLEEEGKGKELEEKRTEDEEEACFSPGSPISPQHNSDNGVSIPFDLHLQETKRIADLLKLPVSDMLGEIVREFLQTPTISLAGEAIEARAWIEDAQRNKKGQQMTPAFFRRWLKRERGDYGVLENTWPTPSGLRKRENRHLSVAKQEHQASDPYRAFFLQRLAEVKENCSQEAVL